MNTKISPEFTVRNTH